MVDDQILGRVKLRVYREDGTRTDYGRLTVRVEAGHAYAERRNMLVVSGAVATFETGPGHREYMLTMDSGDRWSASGCGCGGG